MKLPCSPLFLLLSVITVSNPCYAKISNPNVVIIYGDDLGYGDVGAYGSKKIPTPNIDALASQGLKFTDGHCTAATCSPSRFSMLTGTHSFRANIRILAPNAPLCIPVNTYTLADLFKEAGYDTAIIGKWHLGLGSKEAPADWNSDVKPGPLEIGFDYSFLLPSTNDRVPCVYLENYRVVDHDPNDPIFVGFSPKQVNRIGSTAYPDGKLDRAAMTYYPSSHGHEHSVINGIGRIGYMAGGKQALWDDETMADVFVGKARAYISKNRDKPFFLYFSSQDIHVPRAPHPRFHGKTDLGYRGDATVQFDWTVGQIVEALKNEGLFDNTILILSSDNGPAYDDGYVDGTTVKTSKANNDQGHYGAGPYRGGKYQIYEGGTRVPFIITWPKEIQPDTSDALVSQIDFLHSFATFLKIQLPEDAAPDSRDTLDAFLGQSKEGLPFMIEEAANALALRKGEWKYIEFHPSRYNPIPLKPELYNLRSDAAENNNQILGNPEIAASLKAQLDALQQSKGICK
ncbi:MAG: Arylsulfatase [Opitutia bacterium UBA7350]|nr:MAG: Arylsulfatase [Opitutae bacterium UBA7350]